MDVNEKADLEENKARLGMIKRTMNIAQHNYGDLSVLLIVYGLAYLIMNAMLKFKDWSNWVILRKTFLESIRFEYGDLQYVLYIILGIVFFSVRLMRKKRKLGNYFLYDMWLLVLAFMPIFKFAGDTIKEVVLDPEWLTYGVPIGHLDEFEIFFQIASILYFSHIISIWFAVFLTGVALKDIPVRIFAILMCALYLILVLFEFPFTNIDMVMADGVLVLGLYCYPLGRLVNKDE